MAYLALYRQFRPQKFADVVGQNHITKALRNQIIHSRIAHAYLLSGSRGTGKTSTAKIFSKAVNCLNPQDGEPCGACALCLDPNPIDIIEIDAASNTQVDQMRDLLEKVKLVPVNGKYKVYIIDEVHMLSSSSFNALLKTLEEPPSHIIFILATTEPQKVLATIHSRCQKYEFHRLPSQLIADTLKNIISELGASIEDKGVIAIARAAEGGMRDALSLLDQCIAFCGKNASYAQILEVLGSMDQGFMLEVSQALIDGDCKAALHGISDVINKGRDLSAFCSDLISVFRDELMIKTCGDAKDLLDISDEIYTICQAQARAASKERLLRAISLLCEAEGSMKWLPPRVMLEAAFVRICQPHEETSFESLAERVAVLENSIAKGISPSAQAVFSPASADFARDETPLSLIEEELPFDIDPPAIRPPVPPVAKEPLSPPFKTEIVETAASASVQDDLSLSGNSLREVFEYVLSKQKPNLIPMIKDSSQTLEGNKLTILISKKHAAFVNMLGKEAPKMAQSVADKYPDLVIVFSEDDSPKKDVVDIKKELMQSLGSDIPIFEK